MAWHSLSSALVMRGPTFYISLMPLKIPGSRSFRLTLFAALIGIFILIVSGIQISEKTSWNRTLAPVRLAISVASTTGLEYPQAIALSDEMQARYRAEEFGDQLDLSLDWLRAKFDEDDSHSPETAYWLGAGLTVAGQLETARAAVDIGRVHHPYDQELWTLDVILTEAEGDSKLARERLETLIQMFPENKLARKNLKKL